MCRQLTALNTIAFFFLIVASLACMLSFAAPFWVIYPHAFKTWKVESPPNSLTDVMPMTSIGIAWKGMLAHCFSDLKCTWYWENNFDMEKTLPAWYKASQVMFICALLAILIALLLQSIYSCCMCCERPCRFPTTIASFTISGAVLAGLALGLFGGFAYRDGWFDFQRTGGYTAQLEWAFYVGLGGVGGLFIASMLFFCDGCCLAKSYRGYSRTSQA